MVTSSGIAIAAPGFKTISCERIRSVLDALDQSGYRLNSPSPHRSEDRGILDYESALSEEYYWRCTNKSFDSVGKDGSASYAADAFKYGYVD